ncbi:MAG TPA: DUF2238 domain-containing protein [Spongiibacteraceae bacterium]|jgi:putative membrane protein|nr:DUF2238 domain-containing protein [Spongiibacteraceae bacterium]HUH38550.1 DUF2238 domain-containing protein [Spongiibacteraceae bacterium]
MAPHRQDRTFPALLLGVYALIWLALAIKPKYRDDWLLENVLVLIVVPLLVLAARRWTFSRTAYSAVFLFMVLHAIGSHYTYSEVPYDAWLQSLFGFSLTEVAGFSRNHYDRLVHFCYGLLWLPFGAELLTQKLHLPGVWRRIVPVVFMVAFSACYELIEWQAALLFGGDLGEAYLGTQGDNWDAEKDVALAVLGAVLSAFLVRLPAVSPRPANV